MPQSRNLRRLVLLTAVALTACRGTTSSQAEAEMPLLVTAEPVQLGTIRGSVSATGVVATVPGGDVPIIAPQIARIAEITKNIGDTVESGEMIVRFDFPALRAEVPARAAAVRAAEIRFQHAATMKERIAGLVEKGAASRLEMDGAVQEAATAEAELTDARTRLRDAEAQGQNTTSRAPISGIVSQRLHNPGDLVRPEENDPILRIIDPRQVHVVANVSVADIARFTVGAAARALAEGKSTGELLHVMSRPAPEPQSSAVSVTLSFDAPTELSSGTQVGVEIDAEQRFNILLVPSISVLKDASGATSVMVATGNVAQRRPVKTGLIDAERTEITSGLKPGELVITQGQSGLADGAAISSSTP